MRKQLWRQAGSIGNFETVNLMNIRLLQRGEIPLIWQIDRSEVIENVYYLRDGKLVLEPEHYDMQGWPPGEVELYTPHLLDCYDRGGTFWGAFENDTLIGVSILESKFIGFEQDTMQLKFLHVSRDYRKRGIASALFRAAVEKAKALGAKKLYISATPSEHTVNYYMRLGCVLAKEIDPQLFELEPEDIHLEYAIA